MTTTTTNHDNDGTMKSLMTVHDGARFFVVENQNTAALAPHILYISTPNTAKGARQKYY
jgi:hypothetical protein